MRHRFSRRLPSLAGLSGADLGQMFREAFSTQRLTSMAWAAGGGAAGGLVGRVALPKLDGLPLVGSVPGWAREFGAAWLLGTLTWNWNREFACGAVGKLAGDATLGVLDRLKLTDIVGAGAGAQGVSQVPPDQLAPLRNVDVRPVQSQLAEVIPQGGLGGFGAAVQPMTRQPTLQPAFEPSLAGVGSFLQ